MRNVTIVESNVEPNKEHLWFYNGELKWFGPNGWEKIYSQVLSPTTTPKPVVPTTTTSTPRPTDSIKFTNKTDVDIEFHDVYSDIGTASPPIPPGLTCVLKYRFDDATVHKVGYLPFNTLKITAFRGSVLVQENVPYVVHSRDESGTCYYVFSFKELMNKGVTDVLIQDVGSSATTSSTTSTPEPILTTPFGVRIDNNLADKVDIYATAAEAVNKSIEPGGTTQFQILPNGRGGIFSFIVRSENLHDTVSKIRVEILGKVGDNTINQTIISDNGGINYVEYSASAALSTIDLNIQLFKYVEEATTTSTTTSTTTRPPNGSGREMQLYTGYGITHSLSALMTSKDSLYDGLIDMEDKFYPLDGYDKAYYSTSGKYLAVVHSTEAKDTIVASIVIDSASGSGKHTLYPKETAISGNTRHRFFLFDLSESPYLESTYDRSTIYVELSAYTPDTISTIAPFIDGNIPPFADEE